MEHSALRMQAAGVQALGVPVRRHVRVLLYAGHAEDSDWIEEQLGKVTASRIYVVEHDAEKRRHCQGTCCLSTMHWQPAHMQSPC